MGVPGGDTSFEGIMMRLLLVFVAVVAMLEFTLADPVEEDKDIECCQCYGKCAAGSYLLATYPGDSPTYFDCLMKCQTYTDPNEPLAECRFFSHDNASPNNCYLYSNCPSLDGSCFTCISGDAQCDPLNCNLFGKQCQGVLVGEEKADTQLQCACQCDEERDCNYYTFNAEVKLCSLFATCDSYFDCSACVTGDEQCWQELGGDCSLSPPTQEKMMMIIGGITEVGFSDDIELVSLDSSPVPQCLSSLNP